MMILLLLYNSPCGSAWRLPSSTTHPRVVYFLLCSYVFIHSYVCICTTYVLNMYLWFIY